MKEVSQQHQPAICRPGVGRIVRYAPTTCCRLWESAGVDEFTFSWLVGWGEGGGGGGSGSRGYSTDAFCVSVFFHLTTF